MSEQLTLEGSTKILNSSMRVPEEIRELLMAYPKVKQGLIAKRIKRLGYVNNRGDKITPAYVSLLLLSEGLRGQKKKLETFTKSELNRITTSIGKGMKKKHAATENVVDLVAKAEGTYLSESHASSFLEFFKEDLISRIQGLKASEHLGEQSIIADLIAIRQIMKAFVEKLSPIEKKLFRRE